MCLEYLSCIYLHDVSSHNLSQENRPVLHNDWITNLMLADTFVAQHLPSFYSLRLLFCPWADILFMQVFWATTPVFYSSRRPICSSKQHFTTDIFMKPAHVLSNGTFWEPCRQVDSLKSYLNVSVVANHYLSAVFVSTRCDCYGWKTCGHRPLGPQGGLSLNKPLDLKAAWCRFGPGESILRWGNLWSALAEVPVGKTCFGLHMWAAAAHMWRRPLAVQ